MRGFVLVGGWPGSGKTTLARALASECAVPYLSKDLVKEALMDALGPPPTVEESRLLGRAAVIDSTWYPYTVPLVRSLPGPLVELRCRVSREVARERFGRRHRDARHLDGARSEEELWGSEVAALGVGPLVEVDTSGPVDIARAAAAVRSALAAGTTG